MGWNSISTFEQQQKNLRDHVYVLVNGCMFNMLRALNSNNKSWQVKLLSLQYVSTEFL